MRLIKIVSRNVKELYENMQAIKNHQGEITNLFINLGSAYILICFAYLIFIKI
jgi:ABC-type amino acid transport system permease subunit